jgi:glycosyltransferase involved in cell wall biosynthesis
MKILVVQESDWLRRNPHQQHQMLERLSAQGHQVLVLDYPIRWRDDGKGLVAPRRLHRGVAKVIPEADITVIRTASLRISGIGKLSWLATNVLEMAYAFRSIEPDVVVILGLSNGLPALLLARLAGVPVVVHLIDALHTLAEPRALRPIARWFERQLLSHADWVIVINKALGAYAVRLGADPAHVERIPTGVDTVHFGPHVSGAAVRAEYGISPDEHVLLFIGWLYTFSGLKELATTMADRPDLAAGLRLLVVGDGDLMPELQRLRDQRLGNRLVLAGQQPAARMPEFAAAADICLLPTEVNETTAHIVPAKLYDYLAASKPIVASPLPGLQQEFGTDGGISFADGPGNLLTTVATLLASPEELAQRSAAISRTVEAIGGWDDVTKRYADVLSLAHSRSKRLAAGDMFCGEECGCSLPSRDSLCGT